MDCAKTRTRKTTMPYYCRKPRGHEGKCSPYTLAPMTRERWAELGVRMPGTAENVHARQDALGAANRRHEPALPFEADDLHAITSAEIRAASGDALTLFD